MNKSAQIAVTFNWMYVLIAGGVILLFFVGLIFAQKEKSEQRIAIDVVGIMDSIFAGAQVSEKTLTPIKTSGISEYTLTFECDEGVTRFGIENSQFSAQEPISPIFAPSKLQTNKMLLWSLPYQLPYKAGDFLFVTSTNTQFFIKAKPEFINEFVGASEGNKIEDQMKITPILTNDEYLSIRASPNSYMRVIDMQGGTLFSEPVAQGIASLDDERVTGVAITPLGAQFYKKLGTAWQQDGVPVAIVTLGLERDAATFAALFAANSQMYQCSMQNSFKRATYVTQAYVSKVGKLQEIVDDPVCLEHYEKVGQQLEQMQNKIATCSQSQIGCTQDTTNRIVEHADEIQKARRLLTTAGCMQVY